MRPIFYGDILNTRALISVVTERVRQINVEGFGASHDDQNHSQGELARAAICYIAVPFPAFLKSSFFMTWPWDMKWWRPTTERRNLVKAAALILARIEQIDRNGDPVLGAVPLPVQPAEEPVPHEEHVWEGEGGYCPAVLDEPVAG